MKYSDHVSAKETPQGEAIPGRAMVANSDGAFVFAVDDWKRMERFLILGSEGGSYYAGERKLTRENADAVIRCVKADGARAVKMIVDVSVAGRAPKNDAAIFALAIAAKMGDDETRRYALISVWHVCRIGTHLFQFAEAIEAFGGWGRGTRRAMAHWFTNRTNASLAEQVVKYQSRGGWRMRDLLRLAHPKTADAERGRVFKWAATRPGDARDGAGLGVIEGFERIHAIAESGGSAHDGARIIAQYALPREAVPSKFLTEPETWDALLPHMKATAMIRNLATMSRVGLIKPFSKTSGIVASRIIKGYDEGGEFVRGRVHPFAILLALTTYAAGHGVKGSGTWTPDVRIMDALDVAFYGGFGAITPSGKRTMIALDVSGSMAMEESKIAGTHILAREASVAMALVTANTEEDYAIGAFSRGFVPVGITAGMRLQDAVRVVSDLPFDSTDCSVPMRAAVRDKIDVDHFVIFTDSETNVRSMLHPAQALRQYRQKTGIATKMTVVAMTSNGFTIADPDDAGMMDVVGFDANAPGVMADFARTQG